MSRNRQFQKRAANGGPGVDRRYSLLVHLNEQAPALRASNTQQRPKQQMQADRYLSFSKTDLDSPNSGETSGSARFMPHWNEHYINST